MERLATKAESGQSYDLEEEHTAICELLRNEMRRRGYAPPPINRAAAVERTAGQKQSSEPLTQLKHTHKQVHCSHIILFDEK